MVFERDDFWGVIYLGRDDFGDELICNENAETDSTYSIPIGFVYLTC